MDTRKTATLVVAFACLSGAASAQQLVGAASSNATGVSAAAANGQAMNWADLEQKIAAIRVSVRQLPGLTRVQQEMLDAAAVEMHIYIDRNKGVITPGDRMVIMRRLGAILKTDTRLGKPDTFGLDPVDERSLYD